LISHSARFFENGLTPRDAPHSSGLPVLASRPIRKLKTSQVTHSGATVKKPIRM
jgi:hypothetical protein